jgi:hypothetical protein
MFRLLIACRPQPADMLLYPQHHYAAFVSCAMLIFNFDLRTAAHQFLHWIVTGTLEGRNITLKRRQKAQNILFWGYAKRLLCL